MISKFSKLTFSVAILAGLIALGGCESNQLEAQRNKLWNQNVAQQKKIDHLQKALDASENSKQGLQQRVNSLKNQLASAKKASRPAPPKNTGFDHIKGVSSKQGNGKVTVEVPGDILFSSGKVTLKSTAKKTLRDISKVIKNKYSNDKIRIEGYTDKDPIRKSHWKDNLELSLERAAAVQRYLSKQGISMKDMYSAGFGMADQLSTKAKSRRVEIVVILPH